MKLYEHGILNDQLVKNPFKRVIIKQRLNHLIATNKSIRYADQKFSSMIYRFGIVALFTDDDFSKTCFELYSRFSYRSKTQLAITSMLQQVIKDSNFDMTHNSVSMVIEEE